MRLVIALGKFFCNISYNLCILVYDFLDEKWLFSYRNNDISCTHAIGAICSPARKFRKDLQFGAS